MFCLYLCANKNGGATGGGEGAELAYDKNLHKKLFDGEVEYDRFYRYLRYASMNTFIHLAEKYWDKMVHFLYRRW